MVELLECALPGIGPGCLLWYIWVGVVLKCIAAKPGESENPNFKSYTGKTREHLPITGHVYAQCFYVFPR